MRTVGLKIKQKPLKNSVQNDNMPKDKKAEKK